MTFKKYRVRKEFIYDNPKLKDQVLYRTASLFGYAFVKDGNRYYSIHIKQYKTKPDELIVEMVDLEIVGDIREGNE